MFASTFLSHQRQVLCWHVFQGITKLLVVLADMHQVNLKHTVVLHQSVPGVGNKKQSIGGCMKIHLLQDRWHAVCGCLLHRFLCCGGIMQPCCWKVKLLTPKIAPVRSTWMAKVNTLLIDLVGSTCK